MLKSLRKLTGILCVLLLLSGCWSSTEIEDLALYLGLSLDAGKPAPKEKDLERKGARYPKQDKLLVTIQVVPAVGVASNEDKSLEKSSPFFNISGSGDSILQIFRQFSIRLDRPIIGHHLKVIVISADLLKKQSAEQLTDFLLRDNDIRPSCIVLVSEGEAMDVLVGTPNKEIPAVALIGMSRNRSRTSKVMRPVTLARLDAMIHSRKSFVLQRLITAGKETLFSGAEIIKGSIGQSIGSLGEDDTMCLTWLRGEGDRGVIKVNDSKGEPLVFEMKSLKSKITPHVEGEEISFDVKITTTGRIIETWSKGDTSTTQEYADEASKIFEEELIRMMTQLIHKLQDTYAADVAGFGDQLAIKYPSVWKKVKDDWDERFSQSKISISYKLSITDFGSFSEKK
ncbi:germination protein [Paenibacillus antibioticophila]|uniref:Germination protein n=1 Tax=Paenibacillus antibioticophila TaxID=1274374 RepID=A0A919XSI4_9BACL|nr:Ger(x)C family spore germination protein [Paenibacillus antibioticophila]GIO35523.1 germination protein [Paenibacillus antibioticophila]